MFIEFYPTPNQEELTLQQAYKVVYGAGNIALEQSLPGDHKSIIADELGKMFSLLDLARDNECPVVSADTLLASVNHQIDEVYNRELLHDGPINPLTIHDEKLNALASLSLFILSAKGEIIRDQR